jgi:hypothetical protein
MDWFLDPIFDDAHRRHLEIQTNSGKANEEQKFKEKLSARDVAHKNPNEFAYVAFKLGVQLTLISIVITVAIFIYQSFFFRPAG